MTKNREWLAKHKEELEERKRLSEERRAKQLAHAKAELDRMYAERKDRIAKTHAANLESQHSKNEEKENVLAKGSDWERICYLIDFKSTQPNKPERREEATPQPNATATNSQEQQQPKHPRKDVSRFKEVLLKLKQN